MVTVHPSVADLYPPAFLERVQSLRQQAPLRGSRYYLAEFSVDSWGYPNLGWKTQWVGYTNSRPKREIRQVRPVDAVSTVQAHQEFGFPAIVANKPQDFVALMMFGGFGVVEESVATFFYPEFLEPMEMARDSSGLGFRGVGGIPKPKLSRAPTKKLRMEILKRESARCKICGRSPSEDVTIELHVHHVIPWGRGGLTEAENLITLCHTCHGGLDPHEDPFVRDLIRKEVDTAVGYEEELMRYQESNRPFLEAAR